MITRADLQQISRIRIQEARTLLANEQYAGAYYLAGYSVECALKACIARQTRRYAFPDKARAERSHTHDLQRLVRVAGLQDPLQRRIGEDSRLAVNWAIAKDWSERSRYSPSIAGQLAQELYTACTESTHGVLPWVQAQW